MCSLIVKMCTALYSYPTVCMIIYLFFATAKELEVEQWSVVRVVRLTRVFLIINTCLNLFTSYISTSSPSESSKTLQFTLIGLFLYMFCCMIHSPVVFLTFSNGFHAIVIGCLYI